MSIAFAFFGHKAFFIPWPGDFSFFFFDYVILAMVCFFLIMKKTHQNF